MKGPTPEGKHIAFLRGINVGGKNKLPMADLREMFTNMGCDDVKTYIQSGNVIFRSEPALTPRIPDLIAEAVLDRFGYEVPVVLRGIDELREITRNNPFLRQGTDTKTLHVAFLAEQPSEAQIASLDPERSRPDEFMVRRREIYLHLPNGVARTKLTNAYFDGRLATKSTLRNWRTLLKCLELADG